MSRTAIIVAAGSGQRMRNKIPKQFLDIDGKPVLWYTLRQFESCSQVDQILVVLPQHLLQEYGSTIKNEWNFDKIYRIVPGAQQRHLSVWNGLLEMPEDTEIVIIHDGVRPLVTHAMIRHSVEKALQAGAAVVGVKPKDTVKRVQNDHVLETIPRDDLIMVQTPQTFRKQVILDANRQAFESGMFSTDDAALVEMAGYPVVVVPGDWTNIKITTPEDLKIAQVLLRERRMQ